MAVIQSAHVWLNDALDPSDRIRVDNVTGFEDQTELAGQERTTAAGTIRSVVGVGETRQFPVECSAVSPAQRNWLQSHKGRDIWVRTPHGLMESGKYRDLKIKPVIGSRSKESDVTFTFRPIHNNPAV